MTTQNEREIAMFGCTKAAIDASLKNYGHPMMHAMGMMSDAQEMMERGLLENARQVLNRAKYVVSEFGFKDLDAPKPLVLTDVQKQQVGMALTERARYLRSQSAREFARTFTHTNVEAVYDECHEATMTALEAINKAAA